MRNPKIAEKNGIVLTIVLKMNMGSQLMAKTYEKYVSVPIRHFIIIVHLNSVGVSLIGCFLNLKISGVVNMILKNDLIIVISKTLTPAETASFININPIVNSKQAIFTAIIDYLSGDS